MPLNITRGKKAGAVRGMIYGTEGIGKSTFASKIPNALVIDTEDGTGQIDVARVVALDWRAIEHAFKELAADTQGFSAVIVDTADWLEKALIEHMLKQAGKKSIEDFGYGKGYTILQEHVVRFLALVDQLIAQGVHVVFVAHAKVTRTSPPDQTDGYDRYELKLTKQVAPLLKEWADLVLFCNYKIQIVEGNDGKLKAQGGRERVMYATHSAAWDAKNRFGLPDEMPMEFERIAHIFGAAAPRTPAQAKAAAVEAATVADPAPVSKVAAAAPVTLATSDQVDRIEAAKADQRAVDLIEAALSEINAIDVSELTSEQADALLAQIAALPHPAAWTDDQATWLNVNGVAVNAYLRHVNWLGADQTWSDLPTDKAEQITAKWAKFQTAARNHGKGAKKAA